ncbi:MAG: hypothetical protein Q4A01_02560 [Coriobacteriales bacterium]|nr:hypothetical protein [Coriobacteriales bacterium]
MRKHTDLGTLALAALNTHATLRPKDLGSDARLSKRGMTFTTEAYDVEGVGHLCIMRMKAFAGLMRMETVILAPAQMDMPLFNIDWVRAFGKETQIAELYDDQLQPWPDVCQEEIDRIRRQYDDLPNMAHADHWYDDILYPCSCAKQGKGIEDRLAQMAQDYLAAYVAQLGVLPACDHEQKAAAVRSFAEHLYADGGPAVQQVAKLFGQQTAQRLVVHHMYGVEDDVEG